MSKPLNLPFDPIARAAQSWERHWGPCPPMAAITSIMRAQQILLAEADAVLKPYGLTFARYEALVLLTFSRSGALPLSKIGERLMVHPTSVTNTIDRLEKSEFVARRPNPRDGRGTLATITDKGRDVVERATAELVANDFGLGVYDAEQCAEIFRVLLPLRVDAGDFTPDEQPAEEPTEEHAEEPVGGAAGEPVGKPGGEAAAVPEQGADSEPAGSAT
ncbi:MarR family transcriptional regulator [Yinghuangia aomiensis]|uniref:MarR family transcriptional regulator n=1 Tax=Yinghuangia aomiensis TaxID=676205 RepID=A0ABP9GQG8_9ACTN